MLRLIAIIAAIALLTPGALAATRNGFDLTDATVPEREIRRGGPPRDGIVALTNPSFETAPQTPLADDARVLGITFNGIAKAYPINLLTVHEIVNDVIGAQFLAVTYCPLCGSGVVFATNIGEVHLNFGVSGLLYNSDMLLYDRNTESLWSQLTGTAISGRLKGTKLPVMPVWHTTWQDWREMHPHSLVMRGDERFAKSYRHAPYPGYAKARRIYFPVNHKAPKTYHPKERVFGVVIDGVAKAYPFVELDRQGAAEFSDEVNGRTFHVIWNEQAQSAAMVDSDRNPVTGTTLYWFAWYAFHPDTTVFTAPNAP